VASVAKLSTGSDEPVARVTIAFMKSEFNTFSTGPRRSVLSTREKPSVMSPGRA